MRPGGPFSLRVCQFNLLCPAYGVKWGELEACVDASAPPERRQCNWAARWPALRRLLSMAQWDVLCMQELQEATLPSVRSATDELGMELRVWNHPGREDALGVAFRRSSLSCERESVAVHGPAATGVLDLTHKVSARRVRVVCTHQKGGVAEQMAALLEAAESTPEGAEAPDLTLLAGDFNEDFGAGGGLSTSAPARAGYKTLPLARPAARGRSTGSGREGARGPGRSPWSAIRSPSPACSPRTPPAPRLASGPATMGRSL
eukprot:TRINITY_DN19750_c0_g1_i1.p1 TRINITY_DN19750_c0_g1~~TRINITY_DN19750_c0_g1_i1.p1  ORF type:complete len:305 (+),score=65.67 TRINITY_DN19750_c0_g1_i1:133-915(+)